MGGKSQFRRRGNKQIKKQAKIYASKHSRVMDGKFFSTSVGGVFFEMLDDGTLKDQKYFIDVSDTMGAMNGDIVSVKLLPKGRDVRVCDILERAVTHIIGTYNIDERYPDECFVDPDDTKHRLSVAVIGCECETIPSDQDKVEIKIIYYPERFGDEAEGVITKVFGHSADLYANYNAILHENDIITEFSPEALSLAAEIEKEQITSQGRVDFRDKLIFTIDGADAKDLDDAISVEKNGSGYTLGVHIADVSHYVTEKTVLDKEAMQRGTSVYFTDKVVPMLPKALSNGICSLNSGIDRYALSAIIDIDRFGEIQKVTPCKSIINSKVRGVYSEVNELIDGSAGDDIENKYQPVLKTLDIALELYEILKRKSERRGALELDSAEGVILLDNNGVPVEIIKRERGVAERLIEQFMLCANEAVATYLSSNEMPCVYRIHEKPDPDKVGAFIKFANNLDLTPPYIRKESVNTQYLGKILEKAKAKGVESSVSYLLLRTMQKAKYSEVNSGHFGLSSKCYCHFTSPIRRYSDLAVHRILSEVLAGSNDVNQRFTSYAKRAAKKASETELKALEAERAIDDLYKALYMGQHIGDTYEAIITSVNSFGFFCELDNTCEGLVPISSLKNRYWYDADMHMLSCTHNSYKLGDCVKIKVKSVDVSLRRVDFELVDEPVYNEAPHRFRG